MPDEGMLVDLHLGLADLERFHIVCDPSQRCARFRTTRGKFHFPPLDDFSRSFAVEEEVSRRREWARLLDDASKRDQSSPSFRLKDASSVSDLSEETLLALRKNGRLPIDTEAGVLIVGDKLSSDDRKWVVDLVNKHRAVFDPNSRLGITGISPREISLSPGYLPRKVRFRLKDQPILKKVLLNKISKGVLEYWRQG
jgi:hypothetical protein